MAWRGIGWLAWTRRPPRIQGDASVGNSIPSIPFVAEFEVVGIWIDSSWSRSVAVN